MSERRDEGLTFSCPVPLGRHPRVLMAHGGGGTLSRQLLEEVFLPAFACEELLARHDGARLDLAGARLAFTTDSYVVRPLFFPGGDIGALAVHGTVNDLAMCGARPLHLSAGFILEEGLDMETLRRVVGSMQEAARAARVTLVTGDTKVVERGKADGLYVCTAGLGLVEHDLTVSPAAVQPGDAVLLSGDVGRHGIAIMAVREGLAFETTLESDCAPVADAALSLLAAGLRVHCLRDLTRGGLASALVEIASDAGVGIHIDERSIPLEDAVRSACEILGFDPLHVACEGRFVAFVPAEDSARALDLLRAHPCSAGAVRIGQVGEDPSGRVTLTSAIGATRLVDMLSGEQLPRIC